MHVRKPIIDTSRLRLRLHAIDDLDACAALWGDANVTRYIGGRTFTREETWQRILRYAGLWALLDYGYWLIEERSTGAFVGELGFADFKRDIDPAFADFPEMGWVVTPAMQGRGYATEALVAALAWGDAHLGATHIVCLIAPENTASIRLAGKHGFLERTDISYRGTLTRVFARPAGGAKQ